MRRMLPLAMLLAAPLSAPALLPPAPPPPGVWSTELGTTVPATPREFRAAWVATVGNIDWPSKAGLSTQAQQAEMIALLDRAVALNLNAIVLQVRPDCDAFYDSKLEPWSEYLTGVQGQAPSPYYDPLEFACREAHARGLEMHCWFNPYRARNLKGDMKKAPEDDAETTHLPRYRVPSPAAPNHVSVAKPELVREYVKYQWMDPGEPATQEHALAVILDVVRRYDIDGVHMDDYFYPYPDIDIEAKRLDPKSKAKLPFPDDASYAKYQAGGGTLGRGDFRRKSVNDFIERLYKGIKAEKRHVQFGLSPFGIWKPGHPVGIAGLNQYEALYADAKLWLNKGWVDYYTPQLYWPITSQEQSYPALLKWWIGENTQNRHIWPGLFTSKFDEWTTRLVSIEEIPNQIAITRFLGAGGNVHFSMKAFLTPDTRLEDRLTTKGGVYAGPAVVPETTWLGQAAPASALGTAATETVDARGKPVVRLTWQPGSGATDTSSTAVVRRWAVHAGTAPSAGGLDWTVRLLGPEARSADFPVTAKGKRPTRFAVAPFGRLGQEGPPTYLRTDAKEAAAPAEAKADVYGQVK